MVCALKKEGGREGRREGEFVQWEKFDVSTRP